MKWINTDQSFLPHACRIMAVVPSAEARVVAQFDDTEVVAFVIFDGFNGQSVHAHICVNEGKKPTRAFWFAVYHYAFEQLGCKNVIGTVPALNTKAQTLNEHLGFRHIGTIPKYYEGDEDLMMFVATTDTIPDWRKLRPATFH